MDEDAVQAVKDRLLGNHVSTMKIRGLQPGDKVLATYADDGEIVMRGTVESILTTGRSSRALNSLDFAAETGRTVVCYFRRAGCENVLITSRVANGMSISVVFPEDRKYA